MEKDKRISTEFDFIGYIRKVEKVENAEMMELEREAKWISTLCSQTHNTISLVYEFMTGYCISGTVHVSGIGSVIMWINERL